MTQARAQASILVIGSLTVGLLAWMFAQVAEYPGRPREAAQTPAWFAADKVPAGKAEAPPAPSVAARAPAGGPDSGTPEAAATGEPPARLAVAAPTAAKKAVEIAAPAGGAGAEINIALKEYEFVPSAIQARPGTITFVLRNRGRFAHNFHVEGPGVDVKAAKFGPGNTVRVQVTLQAGEYKISCPLSNHDQRGMHGKLLVLADAAGG